MVNPKSMARVKYCCAAVVPARGQKFLRTQHAEQRALLRAEQVLPALAARAGEIAGAQFQSARAVREHGIVLVVGVRADHQHAAQHVQFRQRVSNGRRADQEIFRPQRQHAKRAQRSVQRTWLGICPFCLW